MKKNTNEIYTEEIKKKLGLEEFKTHYLFDSFESIKKWMNICKENIDLEINTIINDYSKKYDYLIVDFCLLPMMDIYNKCNITISVNANVDIKLDRLKKRLLDTNHIQKWNTDSLILGRINSTSLNEHGYESQYTIYNNGTLEELLKQVDELLLKIKK